MKAVLVSPNPTLDLAYSGLDYRLPGKHFFKDFAMSPGGAGVNLARGLHALGCPYELFTILGGKAGRLAWELIQDERLRARAVFTDVETRVATILYSETEKRMAVSKSFSVSHTATCELLDGVLHTVDSADLIYFGGSFSAEPAAYRAVRDALREAGLPVFLDTRGEVLEALLETPLAFVKLDFPEDPETLEAQDMPAALQTAEGSTVVIETPGAIRLFSGGEKRTFAPFDDPERRPYGRGDAFMAGVLFAYMEGFDPCDSIRCGILAARCPPLDSKSLGGIDAERFFELLPGALRSTKGRS